MDRLARYSAVAANIGVLVFVIIASAALIKYTWFNGSAARSVPVTAKASAPASSLVGTKVKLPDVDLTKSDKTLLFVLSETCHFCNESAPFYERIARGMKSAQGVSLVAGFPQPVESAQKYLKAKSIGIDAVRQMSPNEVGAGGFPTLLLIDKNGAIQKEWVGKLSPAREAEVLKEIGCSNCS